MGLRAVKYQRVSQDRQHGRSVTEQERENDLTIQDNDWECVGSFSDTDISASRYTTKMRPEFQNLTTFLERGGADVLVVWEFSRATRDLGTYVELRDLCINQGVKLCYGGRLYDMTKYTDRRDSARDAVEAESESGKTSDRIQRAVRANAQAGRPHGKLLEGYIREYDGTGRFIHQIIYEPEAQVIREIFARFLAGYAMYETLGYFNKCGIRTKRGFEWVISQQKRVLTNPAYIAKRVHQGKIVGDAQWPAIISEADFYRVQAKFNDPARKAKYTRDGAIKYLLSGLALCGECGGPVIANKPRGYPSYTCKRCFCFARKLSAVDGLIEALVIARLKRPDILSLLSEDDETVNDALDVVTGLRARLETFYDEAATGAISAAALGRIEAKLLAEINELELKTRRARVPTILYDLTGNPEVIWHELSITQKRTVISLLLTVRIHRTRRGERTFAPSAISVDWKV